MAEPRAPAAELGRFPREVAVQIQATTCLLSNLVPRLLPPRNEAPNVLPRKGTVDGKDADLYPTLRKCQGPTPFPPLRRLWLGGGKDRYPSLSALFQECSCHRLCVLALYPSVYLPPHPPPPPHPRHWQGIEGRGRCLKVKVSPRSGRDWISGCC